MTWVAMALAGGLGALVRARSADALAGRPHGGSWAIAAVNLSGAFALGVLVGAVTPESSLVTVLGTGFLGGLTTFSSWLTGASAMRGTAGRALTIGGQLALGPALAALGLWLTSG